VGDVRVRASVVPDKDCKAVRLSTVENERVLTAEIPVGTGDVAILASNTMDHEIGRFHCSPLKAGSSNDVALGYSDERLTLVVNEPHLIGRAFLVFWPLWEVKLIR